MCFYVKAEEAPCTLGSGMWTLPDPDSQQATCGTHVLTLCLPLTTERPGVCGLGPCRTPGGWQELRAKTARNSYNSTRRAGAL